MIESNSARAARRPKRYRFGLRWLLVGMLVFAAVFAWLGREIQRANEQTRIVSELNKMEVRVREREPTGLAFLARKVIGRNDMMLREKLGESAFWRPSVLVTWTMTDEQIPELIDHINQLGVVRELHLEKAPLTPKGVSALQHGLPGVAVLTRTDLIKRKRHLQPTDRFASSAFELLAVVIFGLGAVLVVLVWPMLRRREKPAISG